MTIAARACLRAAMFCCALSAGPASAAGPAGNASRADADSARVVSAATLTPASAPAAKQSLSVGDPTSRAYAPQYLPKEVQFTAQELELIRAAVARQVVAYHLSQAQQSETFNALQAAERERSASRLRYDLWTADHAREMGERQARYARIVFWMVLAIVVAGVAGAAYQLVSDSTALSRRMGAWLGRGSTPPGAGAAGATGASDSGAVASLLRMLREQQVRGIGQEGSKITSRVLALLTLLVTMGFFYLCLVQAAPLTPGEAVVPAPASADKKAEAR